jgi:hypothetical protein
MKTGVPGLVAFVRALGDMSLHESEGSVPIVTPIMRTIVEGFICVCDQIEVQQLTQPANPILLQDVRARLVSLAERIREESSTSPVADELITEFYESTEWLTELLGHVAPELQKAFVLASEAWIREQDKWTPIPS